MDPDSLNPDLDPDPDPAFQVNTDPDTDPVFDVQKLEKNKAEIDFFSFFDYKLQFTYP